MQQRVIGEPRFNVIFVVVVAVIGLRLPDRERLWHARRFIFIVRLAGGETRGCEIIIHRLEEISEFSEHLIGCGTLTWVKGKHGKQEFRDFVRLLAAETVLLVEHIAKSPKPQIFDVPQFSAGVEERRAELSASHRHVWRQRAEQLHDERQMVFVAWVLAGLLRVEEELTGEQLEEHASGAPEVDRRAVRVANDDLGAAVLTRLHLVRELFVCPAAVAEVGEADVLEALDLPLRIGIAVFGVHSGFGGFNSRGDFGGQLVCVDTTAIGRALRGARRVHHSGALRRARRRTIVLVGVAVRRSGGMLGLALLLGGLTTELAYLRIVPAALRFGHHAAIALEQRQILRRRRGVVALHDVDDAVLRHLQQNVLRLQVGVDDVDRMNVTQTDQRLLRDRLDDGDGDSLVLVALHQLEEVLAKHVEDHHHMDTVRADVLEAVRHARTAVFAGRVSPHDLRQQLDFVIGSVAVVLGGLLHLHRVECVRLVVPH
mmetsp:Transcript_17744/g.55032  ORF Transcript_17744/g.55032 Transcript_17744/m.55032 type:complete len:486 (-) Transcript_17744:1677-3134(-)